MSLGLLAPLPILRAFFLSRISFYRALASVLIKSASSMLQKLREAGMIGDDRLPPSSIIFLFAPSNQSSYSAAASIV